MTESDTFLLSLKAQVSSLAELSSRLAFHYAVTESPRKYSRVDMYSHVPAIATRHEPAQALSDDHVTRENYSGWFDQARENNRRRTLRKDHPLLSFTESPTPLDPLRKRTQTSRARCTRTSNAMWCDDDIKQSSASMATPLSSRCGFPRHLSFPLLLFFSFASPPRQIRPINRVKGRRIAGFGFGFWSYVSHLFLFVCSLYFR